MWKRQGEFTRLLKGTCIFAVPSDRITYFWLSFTYESHRQYMVYLGGCILAELMDSNTSNFWMTRKEYEEVGPDRAFTNLR
jgi:actin-related protein